MPTDLTTLVEKMADAHDAYRAAETKTGVVARKATKALVAKARIVAKAKAEGYSLDIAENLLNRGEGRAAERAAIINGATATDTPTTPTARIRGGCSTINSAARNGDIRKIRGRESEMPEATWEHDTPDSGKDDSFDWS